MKNNIGIFIDRDGTLIEFPPNEEYVNNKSENLKIIPGSIEAIKFLNHLNYKIIIITNQAGIPYGYSTIDDLNMFNQLMVEEFAKNGARIDAIYYCIHHPDMNCNCRKPHIGMLLQASEDFDIDLRKSCIIGDSKSDIDCGKNAGCNKNILVETGHGKLELEKYNDIDFDFIARDIYDATRLI